MKVDFPAAAARCMICMAAILLALPQASAQPPQEREPRQEPRLYRGQDSDAVDPRELLEQVMMARLSKELQLDDQQTVILVRQISEHRDRLRELRQRRSELMRELKRIVDDPETTPEQIEEKLAELLQHEDESFNARREFFETAAAGLTTEQRARLYVFLNDFDTQLRGIIERARGHRRDDSGERRSGPPSRGPWRGERSDTRDTQDGGEPAEEH